MHGTLLFAIVDSLIFVQNLRDGSGRDEPCKERVAGWLVGAPKMRPLHQKVRAGSGRNPKMILSQNCIDFDTKTYRFGHISGPSYKGAHAGWPAGWLVG